VRRPPSAGPVPPTPSAPAEPPTRRADRRRWPPPGCWGRPRTCAASARPGSGPHPCGPAGRGPSMPFTMPAVDRADHRVLDGGVAERAVLGHDAQLVAVLLGVGGEAVGGEGVGHGVQRGAERARWCRRSDPPMAAAIGPAVLDRRPPRPWPRPGSAGSRERALPSRVTSRSSWRTGSSRVTSGPWPGSAWTAGRRRPPAAGGHLEVARRRPACRGGGGPRWGAGRSARPPRLAVTPSVLVGEEVDLAAGGVAEGRGDGGDRRGELGRAEGLAAASTSVFYLWP
jgi:hypothetical protein